MKPLRLSENVISITEFKAKASDWLQRIAESEEPLVLTQNGQAAGVVLSPRAFDELTEGRRFVAAIEEGLRDARAGQVTDHDEVRDRLIARFSAT